MDHLINSGIFTLYGMAIFMCWIGLTDAWNFVKKEIDSWDGVLEHADQVFKFKQIK